MRIWKEHLPLDEGADRLTVETTGILSVGHDANGVPSVWFWEAPAEPGSNPLEEVVLYGTGHTVPDEPGRYVGTIVWRTLVLHAFARKVP